MRRGMKPLCSLLLICSFGFSLMGQEVKSGKPALEKTATTEKPAKEAGSEPVLTIYQQRALGMLDQLFETSKDFSDDKVRIQVQARIADALWEHDEARARQQFEDAFRGIDAISINDQQEKD